MPWLKVDDGFHNHPKVLAAGNAATGLWTRCGSYCSQHSTNGHIPDVIVKAYGTRAEVTRLIDVGLWRKVPGGYEMHDFLEYNPSADKVRQDRADAADRQRIGRERRAAEAAEKRRLADELSRSESQRDNGDRHAVTDPDVTKKFAVGHTYPDPTRPDPSSLLHLPSTSSSRATGEPDQEINEWSQKRRLQ